jgi:hypothetical protein
VHGRGKPAHGPLKRHPRRERMIDTILAPMHEAANAIAI